MSNEPNKAPEVASPSMIRLRSSDDVVFHAHLDAVMLSNTLSIMLETCGGIEDCAHSVIPVPKLESRVLAKVLEWCEHHKYEKVLTAEEQDKQDRVKCGPKGQLLTWHDDQLKNRDNLSSWDVAFVDMKLDMVFGVYEAANYLDISGLVTVCAKAIAKRMKDKSPRELNVLFDTKTKASLERVQQIHEDFRNLFDEYPELNHYCHE